MKRHFKTTCLAMLLVSTPSSVVFADTSDPASTSNTSQNTSSLVTYLRNLGTYLGYDLTKAAPQNSTTFVSATNSQLLGSNSSTGPAQPLFFKTLLYDFFGALPVNATSQQFVPSSTDVGLDPNINKRADATYPSYATPSASAVISVNSTLDQQPYQPDPVSQGILNLLSTPDSSYCMDSAATTWDPNCTLLVNVTNNVIGKLPTLIELSSNDYYQSFLNQLNASTLLSPLLYSTDSTQAPQTNTPQPGQNNGLTAQNQAQEAYNFIRYATNSFTPLKLPKQSDYANLYFKATPPQGVTDVTTQPSIAQKAAQASLSNYMTRVRAYAAQVSVVYGNLYYLFSKRLPQKLNEGDSKTSAALNEYIMATWRLFTPEGASKTDWLNQVNQASSAAVGKEAVVLLAEINYQLYLMRQQQDRQLLTNSMLLLLTAQQNTPELGGHDN